MATTLTFANTNVGPNFADTPLNLQVSVLQTSGGALTISSMQVFETTQMGAVISGPYWQTPNSSTPLTGPSLTSGTTYYYPCQVAVPSPNTPGASPNAPNALMDRDIPSQTQLTLVAQVALSDGSTASATLQFPLLSPVRPFPVPQGGALQFNTAGDAVNWFI